MISCIRSSGIHVTGITNPEDYIQQRLEMFLRHQTANEQLTLDYKRICCHPSSPISLPPCLPASLSTYTYYYIALGISAESRCKDWWFDYELTHLFSAMQIADRHVWFYSIGYVPLVKPQNWILWRRAPKALLKCLSSQTQHSKFTTHNTTRASSVLHRTLKGRLWDHNEHNRRWCKDRGTSKDSYRWFSLGVYEKGVQFIPTSSKQEANQ